MEWEGKMVSNRRQGLKNRTVPRALIRSESPVVQDQYIPIGFVIGID